MRHKKCSSQYYFYIDIRHIVLYAYGMAIDETVEVPRSSQGIVFSDYKNSAEHQRPPEGNPEGNRDTILHVLANMNTLFGAVRDKCPELKGQASQRDMYLGPASVGIRLRWGDIQPPAENVRITNLGDVLLYEDPKDFDLAAEPSGNDPRPQGLYAAISAKTVKMPYYENDRTGRIVMHVDTYSLSDVRQNPNMVLDTIRKIVGNPLGTDIEEARELSTGKKVLQLLSRRAS